MSSLVGVFAVFAVFASGRLSSPTEVGVLRERGVFTISQLSFYRGFGASLDE